MSNTTLFGSLVARPLASASADELRVVSNKTRRVSVMDDRSKKSSEDEQEDEKGQRRITVALTPRADAALARIREVAGDSTTEAVSRALVLYAEAVELLHAGGKVLFEDKAGERERLKLL
jgi:hypothetical protein